MAASTIGPALTPGDPAMRVVGSVSTVGNLSVSLAGNIAMFGGGVNNCGSRPRPRFGTVVSGCVGVAGSRKETGIVVPISAAGLSAAAGSAALETARSEFHARSSVVPGCTARRKG
jgi:hypothetical protein